MRNESIALALHVLYMPNQPCCQISYGFDWLGEYFGSSNPAYDNHQHDFRVCCSSALSIPLTTTSKQGLMVVRPRQASTLPSQNPI